MEKNIFSYDFFEGDKGVVFAVDMEQAEEKFHMLMEKSIAQPIY